MFQLCSTFLAYQKIISSIVILTNLVLAEERPRSALEWITVSEAKKLPNGFCNEDLVLFGEGSCITVPLVEGCHFCSLFSRIFNVQKTFCRAMKDGCNYPGVAITWQEDGLLYTTECRIITKEKVYESIDKNFQLLYNPNGAAQITWRRWDKGTGNLNFPKEVVKSDESQSCNFMLARYNDYNEFGFVDRKGYVYYKSG